MLADEKIPFLFFKPPSFLDSAYGTLLGRRQHQFRAKGLENGFTLLAHVGRHHKNSRVVLHCGNHRKTDASIAGRRLDKRVTRFQNAARLRVLNHVQRRAVLDRTPGVKTLEFDPEGPCSTGIELVQADGRGVPNSLQDIVVLHSSILTAWARIKPRGKKEMNPDWKWKYG